MRDGCYSGTHFKSVQIEVGHDVHPYSLGAEDHFRFLPVIAFFPSTTASKLLGVDFFIRCSPRPVLHCDGAFF
jgi:hypothetical protein